MSHVIDAPGSTPAAGPVRVEPSPRRRMPRVGPAVAVTLLTIVGGALRFWRLDQPALWGDEVATFRRVCGTFQQLVDQLAVGGFTPLHYLLYYGLKQHTTLTPTVVRLPPAIFGTLLIPAIYFLARQLVRPPVALLAAALTACSAYQLNFSRDAKMYAELWLCGTIHMACFFWWLRTRDAIAWWGWVAAGVAMMGVQFVGAAVYPIELLILLTTPNGHWRQLGLMTRYLAWWPGSILWLPIAAWRRRAVGARRFTGRGFSVLPSETRGHDPLPPVHGGEGEDQRSQAVDAGLRAGVLPLTLTLSPAYGGAGTRAAAVVNGLIGLRLATRHWLRRRRRIAAFTWPSVVLFLLGLCVAGAAPYTYYLKFNRFFSDVYNADAERLNWMRTGIGWVSGYNDGRGGLDLIRYTATAYGLGWEWPRPKQWSAVDERTGKLLIGVSAALLGFAIVGALPLTRRRVWNRRRSLLWIAVWLVLPAYAFYCASMPNAASPLTWVGQALLKHSPESAWPKGSLTAIWAKPVGQMLDTAWTGKGRVDWHGAIERTGVWFTELRRALTELRGGFRRDNLNWFSIVALLVAILGWAAATLRGDRRCWWVATQTTLVVAGVLLLCVALRSVIAPLPRSVWMPRYLAFVWPAFAVLLAALLYRLPTRPIRWTAVAVVMIANVSVHAAHVLAGSEPPTPRMVRDILDSQPPLASRLFSEIPAQYGSEPGTGVLESIEARYYLAVMSGKPIGPDELRGPAFQNQFLIGKPRLLKPLAVLAGNAISDSSVTQLILWQQLQPKEVNLNDPLEKVLPEGWRRVSQEEFAGRDHWTWTDYYRFRRSVYRKEGR